MDENKLCNLAVAILNSNYFTLAKAKKDYDLTDEECDFISKQINDTLDQNPEIEEEKGFGDMEYEHFESDDNRYSMTYDDYYGSPAGMEEILLNHPNYIK